MKLYTADLHLNHRSIIESCHRDFLNVKDMNTYLVQQWNSVAKDGDMVYVVGDLVFPNKGDGHDPPEILAKLNGQIILILGNHDDKNRGLLKGLPKIQKVCELLYMKSDSGQKMMLCHYPMITWRASVHGSWHLYGHSHGNLTLCTGKMMDVGVDTHPSMRPYTWKEIEEIMATRPDNTDLK